MSMKPEDIKDDINWTGPIIGMSVQLIGGTIDSNGDAIEPMVYYNVGKQEVTGKVAIVKIEKPWMRSNS